jgi:hypothetical protein
VGPLGVVNSEPFVGEQLNLLDRFKDVLIKHLVAISPIEALDEGILIGLAGSDVQPRDVSLLTPFLKTRSSELRAIVHTEQ